MQPSAPARTCTSGGDSSTVDQCYVVCCLRLETDSMSSSASGTNAYFGTDEDSSRNAVAGIRATATSENIWMQAAHPELETETFSCSLVDYLATVRRCMCYVLESSFRI